MFKEILLMPRPVARGFKEFGELRVGHRSQIHRVGRKRDLAFESQRLMQRRKLPA